MLDVHPPHEAAHTWKGFFIHIATIVVGLFIAVGLEQTVEALDHHLQRAELIADFRGECERNINISDLDIAGLYSDRDWQQAWLSTLRQYAQNPDAVSVTLPARPQSMQLQGVSGAVWSVAKTNSKAALLPENLAEIYDRVEHEKDQAYRKSEVDAEGLVALSDMARADGFDLTPLQSSGPVTVTLSLTQRTELTAALSHLIGATNNCIRWYTILKGASEAVLDNVSSRDAMMPYIRKAMLSSNSH